jgi:DNA invertase Pin-like site-specific DNA recombinase
LLDRLVVVGRLIGYARVSTRQQDTDRQTTDLLGAGIRRDDLYVDHGVSGARASRPAFDEALRALHDGDTLVISTLNRLGRSTQNMLALAEDLRGRGASLRVLNLGGGDVDAATPVGSKVFTVMAAVAQMELEIKRERITDSVSKCRSVEVSKCRSVEASKRRSVGRWARTWAAGARPSPTARSRTRPG